MIKEKQVDSEFECPEEMKFVLFTGGRV